VAPPTDENKDFALAFKARFYSDVEETLEKERIDAAIISSPNCFHFEQAMSCVTKSVPVLVEKPVTDLIDDARKLVDRAESLRVPVLVGHHRTYSPLLDSANAFLSSPRFGRLVAVQGAALFYKPAKYFEEGPWRMKMGGGPILINLIHDIGLLRHFCGEIKSVFALAGKNNRKFEVEDSVVITFEFLNGALGNFLLSDVAASSKSWEMTSGENSAYPHFPEEYCYHFAGTNGSLDFPSMHARHYAPWSGPSWWNPFETNTLAFARRNPLELQLDHFVEVVRGNAVPRVSAREGYLNMLVVEAIMRSIGSRAVVELDEH
jgi:predicted dehydrogenase